MISSYRGFTAWTRTRSLALSAAARNRPPYCIRGVAPTIAIERGLSILWIDAICGSVQNSMTSPESLARNEFRNIMYLAVPRTIKEDQHLPVVPATAGTGPVLWVPRFRGDDERVLGKLRFISVQPLKGTQSVESAALQTGLPSADIKEVGRFRRCFEVLVNGRMVR